MNVSSLTSIKNSTEEATETVVATRAEAAKGDRQAIRKLANQQAPINIQNAQPAPSVVNSSRGTVNATA